MMPVAATNAEARVIARDLLVQMGFPKKNGYMGLAKLIYRHWRCAGPINGKAHARAIVRKFASERAAPVAVQLFERTKAAGKLDEQRCGFYSSSEWKAIRYKALAVAGGRCACCGATSATGAVLHVDHIKPRSKFPELALDIANLQVLCRSCNEGKSNIDQTDWRVRAA
jgi:hypothetical protein